MRGSRNFRQGVFRGHWVQAQRIDKKVVFYSSTYFTEQSIGYLKETIFSKVTDGVQLLIPIETYRTCDFLGGGSLSF